MARSCISKYVINSLAQSVNAARFSNERRNLVKTMAAAATLSFSPPVLEARTKRKHKVGIVGAGIAGLCAARQLEKLNISYDLYEASQRTGGRVFSTYKGFSTGQYAELGGELINSGHLCLRQLCKSFHIPLIDRHREIKTMGLRKETVFLANRRVFDDELRQLFKPFAHKIAYDMEKAEKDPSYSDQLDNTPLGDWLDKAAIDPKMKDLIESIYVSEYGRELDQQSTLNLHHLINYEDPSALEWLGDSDEQFSIQGGNSRLIVAIERDLKQQVFKGLRLERVEKKSDGRIHLELNGTKKLGVTYDAIILAIPLSMLRQVNFRVKMDVLKQRAINELGFGQNGKLIMAFKSPLWRKTHAESGTVIMDALPQVIWETSIGQTGPQGILTNFCGGLSGVKLAEGKARDTFNRRKVVFEKIYPGLTSDSRHLIKMPWIQSPFHAGSYTCPAPGQYKLIEHIRRPVGNIFFAGEHTSKDHWGYMEGAASSGFKAAQQIAKLLKV